MKRYDIDCDCDGGHIAGDLFDTEDADGYYMRAGDVIDEIGALQKELSDLKAELAKVSKVLSDVIYSLS